MKSVFTTTLSILLTLASSSTFAQPLWFDVVNNGVKVSGPRIQYDLATSKGHRLQWGPLELKDDFFTINLTSRQKLDANSNRMAYYNLEDMVLFFDWPREILPLGLLEVTDGSGNTLWSKNLTTVEIEEWHQKITQVKEELVKQGKKQDEVDNNSLLKKPYAFFRSKSEPGPTLDIGQKYKFCLKNTEGESFVRICTPVYVMKTKGTQIEMQKEKVHGPSQAQVKFQGATQSLQGVLDAPLDKPSVFFAQLHSGATLEFSTPAPTLKIYDMALSDEKNPDLAQIIAETPAPVFLKSEGVPPLSTLDLKNSLWKATMKVSDHKLYLPGKAGAFFQYDFTIDSLPPEKLRPYSEEKLLNITYSEKDVLKIHTPGKAQSEEWQTLNPNVTQWNRSYFLVKDDKYEHKAYLDIYRGYAGEASLRLTGLASGGSTSIMAEGHLSYWFNSLGQWDSSLLSRQRWGVSGKYIDMLSQISADNAQGNNQDVKIKSTIIDLKYRFTQGLWERDETWGAMLSYEGLEYASYKVPKLGYGFFWARSMPLIFDQIFNYFPLFRYPKWVDLELIKYATPLDSKYTLGDDYAVNFHGKILWTPRFFGEAGFGAKQYYFVDQAMQQGATLNTFYGTLGLGLNF